MTLASNVIIFCIALLHVYFLILEMFLWTKPVGLRIFKNSKLQAETMAPLAANQGLYNGFLAGGLFWGLAHPNPEMAIQIKTFFLICIGLAGVFGGFSVSRRILFIQALPAIVALVLTVFAL
jgi:putative membrane protein